MSQFIDSIKEVKKNYKRYDNWEQAQVDDVAKRRYLSEQLDLPKDKVELTKQKAEAVFRASDLMDKRSEDNCANMEQTTGLIGMGIILPLTAAYMHVSKKLSKMAKTAAKRNKTVALELGFIASSFAIGIGMTLWGTSKQKEASRIGRYQAKKHELKDVKNFVSYTPEQIETAKKLAKNIPDKKENKNITKLIDEMNQMSADKKEYLQSLKNKPNNNEEIKKLLNKEYSPEQLAQAEADKEIVVNIVKDVNMTAESYSESVENAFDTIGMMSLITDIPIYFGVKKLLSKMQNVSQTTKQFAPWLASMGLTIGLLLWGTQEKKEASRVGRYSKRQEILDNPELIMAYSGKQLELAKNVKGENVRKGFFEKIGDNLKFLNKYLKEKPSYQKYKKTTSKENEKLYEALLKTEVSDKQLKDAKNLQQKTFRTFDKVDEMSQRFSEDTEAATEIGKQLVSNGFSILGFAIPAVIALAYSRGKLPLNRITKTISNLTLNNNSYLKKLINKGCEVISKDKNLNKDFNRILIDKNARQKVLEHSEILKVLSELDPEIFSFGEKLKNIKTEEELKLVAKEFTQKHFKQDPVSKWIRNLTIDIIRIKNKKNLEKPLADAARKVKQSSDPFAKLKEFHKKYTTLSKTLLYGGFAPIIAVGIGIPLVISSWLTNIQLKAGRIGIMKAMDEVDNSKLFVDKN